MKPELSELRKWLQTLLKKQNRARLALVLGCIAMALILLSELFPAKAPAAPQAVSPEEGTYKTQLEQQLTELIEQVQGAGKTTVMLTLESGEETVYALDTLSGQTQTQQTHVLLDDGTALEQTVYLPTICGVAVVCEGGGDVRVASRITELVGALLDVPSNRVCVEQRRTRDEKSRTFSSNSRRSHILRTSSRSIRLILSSIVSLAVWLKCTRTI